MRAEKKVLQTYVRPSPFVGIDSKENARESTKGYYKAKREIFPSLNACFIDRFERICDDYVENAGRVQSSEKELIRVIKLPNDISISFFVQSQDRCSYREVLDELENRLIDLREEAIEGYFPDYIRIIEGEPYIALDHLLNISQRIKNRNTKKIKSKTIEIEPKRLFTNVKGRKEKRLALPLSITTEGKDKVNFLFLDEGIYEKAIVSEDYVEELQSIALEYLRGREFKESIYYATCLPFEEELKRVAQERMAPWIEIGDLIFYIPRSTREVRSYGKMYNLLFSVDRREPGEFYLMMLTDNEYDEIEKKLSEYCAKRKNGIIYIPIESAINKIRETRDREDLRKISEQYGEIIPTTVF